MNFSGGLTPALKFIEDNLFLLVVIRRGRLLPDTCELFDAHLLGLLWRHLHGGAFRLGLGGL